MSIPITEGFPGAAQPLTAVERASGAPMDQEPGEGRGRTLRPAMDEYVPEEPREPSGRYWVDRDEDGQPRIYFDDPEAKETGQADQGISGLKEKDGEKEERCIGDTGRVDREIEKLERKREELEQRLNTETDHARIKDLERQLAQVERELKQKDNDTYRKQNSVYRLIPAK